MLIQLLESSYKSEIWIGRLKKGLQWVSITDELVKVILENKDKITSVFSYTNCADELFIQTIAYNCGFKDYIFQPADKQAAKSSLH